MNLGVSLIFKKVGIEPTGQAKVILFNSISLVGTSAVTSGLGFIYWWFAARRFLPDVVGFASTAISVTLLLGALGTLGFGTLLIGELPRQPAHKKSFITIALTTAGFSSSALGTLFALLAPSLSLELYELAKNFTHIALFALGVGLTGISLVFDQALIGLLRGELQFFRNIIFAFVKLVALGLVYYLGVSNSLAIYTTWTIGNFVSLLIITVLLVKGRKIDHFYPDPKLLKILGSTALAHHCLNLILQIPAFLLPLIVMVTLSTEVAAYFYAAWMISNFVSVVPSSLTTVLYAASSPDRSQLTGQMRMTLKLSFLGGIFGSSIVAIAAGTVLRFFGEAYAEQGTWCLRILCLSVFPIIIRSHYIAIHRIDRRISQAAKAFFACAIFELTLAAIGAKILGLHGLSLGWLLAIGLEATGMVGTVYREFAPKKEM